MVAIIPKHSRKVILLERREHADLWMQRFRIEGEIVGVEDRTYSGIQLAEREKWDSFDDTELLTMDRSPKINQNELGVCE